MQQSNEDQKTIEAELRAAPLWRRLLAIFYDSLMLACVVFIAWQPMPLIPDDAWPPLLRQGLRLAYLWAITFLFLGWFWTHGGQTIGMRAWKIRLLDHSANATQQTYISWRQAFIHYWVALISWSLAGMGFFWSLITSQKRTWHEIASGSRLIVTDK